MTATWPDGARCAAVLTFNLDAELFWLRFDPSCAGRPKTLSMGEYGPRRGVGRILDVLDAFGVRTTWFVPGGVARRYPAVVGGIAERGHEIACRGDELEDFGTLSSGEQRSVVERSLASVTDVTGVRPVGFRAPPGETTDATPRVLADAGIRWASMTRADDRPYELLSDGRGTGVIEIPTHWELDDFSQFMFNFHPPFPAGQPRIASYRQVIADWCAEFAAYRRHGLCYVPSLTPECIGKPGRIGMLEELLGVLTGAPDAWMATGSQVATWWREHGLAGEPGGPESTRAALGVAR
jgi:peptidoglycan/xylan/chitin deacetylase (PgdA/CDA1 family)